MAGLPWFELDTDFHDDPKIRGLATRLREPLADSYVSRLYAYCYKHAVDRFDPEVAAETIEDACRWRGRRGVLFDALSQAEVLDREAGKVVVHGVKARLAPHLAKRQADAERQQRRRDKVAKSVGRQPDVTRDVTPDVTRESRGDTDTHKDKDKDPIDPPRPPAPVVSLGAGGERTKLGPLGSQLRSECEAGLGYALTPCSQARADLLEAQVQAAGGVEAARSFVAATIRKRDSDLKSVGGLVEILEAFTPVEARQ